MAESGNENFWKYDKRIRDVKKQITMNKRVVGLATSNMMIKITTKLN